MELSKEQTLAGLEAFMKAAGHYMGNDYQFVEAAIAHLRASPAPAAGGMTVPEGWKWELVPDYKVGMLVYFGGTQYKIYALGDRPGTFDLCHPTEKQQDRYINVPPHRLTPLAAAPSAGNALPADDYKRMFEDAVRSLAAIDTALGIDPDEAGGAGPILAAIEKLKAAHTDDGNCRSCVNNRCVTGPECVTLGRDAEQEEDSTDGELAAMVEDHLFWDAAQPADSAAAPAAPSRPTGDQIRALVKIVRSGVKEPDNSDFVIAGWMAAAREALAAHPPAQADHSAQAQADMVRAGWANWKVDSNSYVPYRTREEAEACVRRSEISATQEGPYEVAELFHIREGSDTKAQAGEVALPEPVANASKGEVAFFVKWTETGAALRGKIPLHTADQLRAYGNARALAAGAGMQERDAKDAKRYREVRMRIGALRDGEKNYPWFTIQMPKAPENVMRGSCAGHFDDAIDAAIATREAGQ